MTEPTELSQLRHLYQNMVNGAVRDTASAKRIAEGLLAPAIAALERTTPQPTQAQAGAVPLTDEMVSKAGRALSDLYATECGIDKEDNWKVYGSDFIETAKLVLEAAHGIKGGADAINEAREMGLGEPG